jgi:Bacterial regulatory helix-turn-helix protein, lysR family
MASRARRPPTENIRNRSKENALRIALATERNSAIRRGDPADLNAFLIVAGHSSFRAASAQLGVTASALSHTRRQFEERLGMRLLHRTTRDVSLAAG